MGSTISFYEQLIAEEVVGTISREDQEILDTAKANRPEVRIIWEEAQAVFSQPGIREWLKQKSPAPPFHPKHKISWYKIIQLTTASAAVLFIAIWFLNPPDNINNSASKATTTYLELSNGKRIDLGNKDSLAIKDFPNLTQDNISTLSAALIVPRGKDFKLMFSDGTIIHLNAASTLHFPISFDDDTREITLIGEAYLKVARAPSHPLLVKTLGGEVTVLGTEFNINSYELNNMEVALVIGKVKVQAGKKSLTLRPGYTASCIADSIRTVPLEEDLMSWRTGVLYFENKPLKDVFEIIPRWLGREIKVENDSVGKQPFTGLLDKNISIRENLDYLKACNRIDYYIDKDSVVHIR